MATTRNSAKALPAKRPAPAKAVTAAKVKPATKAKTSPKAKTVPKAKVAPKAVARKPASVPPERRRNYIEMAAYYIAERRGFAPGNLLDDWVQAEAEIDRLLAEGRLRG